MANGGKRIGAGRKKASHTIQAEAAKAILIQMYLEKVKPINEALLKKAVEGDIQAIKELHDRVWGRSVQPIAGVEDKPLRVIFDAGLRQTPSKPDTSSETA